MNLSNKIKTIYPQITDADFLATVRLQDDGSGPYIKSWNYHGLTQPTADQLAALENDPDPLPLIDPISDRQFFQQLANETIITQSDALAAVKTGTLPAAIETIIASLPADQQFGARMILSGATQFYLAHPLTQAFAAAYGWTSARVLTFWRAAGAL